MYTRALSKIRRKWILHEKITVVFLVNENAKWKNQSVYDRFNSDDRFNTKVVLTIADFDVFCDKTHRVNKMRDNKLFFEKRGIQVADGWDIQADTAVDIADFSPDIVFYQVPYNIAEKQDVGHASAFALCMYIPYYVNQSENFKFMGTEAWHKRMFRFYVLDDYWKAVTAKNLQTGGQNLCVAGHPVFDSYFAPHPYFREQKAPAQYVIYAAHWSVGNVDGLSAFLETGPFMLSYAKKHPEIPWCFTCHPTLLFNLVDKGFMSQEEIDDYVSSWKEIAYCPGTDGNYFDLFRNSKMLISDCGSFRIEYYPTGKPYIYIVSNAARRLSDGKFLSEICRHYHHVHNCAELKAALDRILLNGKDSHASARILDKYKFSFTKRKSADMIFADIMHILTGRAELDEADFSLVQDDEPLEQMIIKHLRQSIDFLAARNNRLTLENCNQKSKIKKCFSILALLRHKTL